MKANHYRAITLIMALAISAPHISQAQTLSSGEIIYLRECAKCHQIGEGAQNRVGPQLNQLFGRKAGSLPDFDHYSEAFAKADFIWTPDLFRAFIKDPKNVVAGTMQIYNGLQNDDEISALIEFLKNPTTDPK